MKQGLQLLMTLINKRISLLIILFTSYTGLLAQTNISGVVNTYVSVTALNTSGTCASSGSTTITVTSTAGFSVNDRVLVIQMKGATADQTNTASFGDILSIGNAGNYEFTTINSIAGLNIITNPLITTFSVADKVQLIRVPVYASANVSGVLTGQAWNGTTGGVVVIEVSGALTLNANIVADALGYMGGAHIVNGPKSCDYSNYYYDETGAAAIDDQKRSAYKGEGIADFVTQKKMGRGKWTNGGGGGNSQNAGGGGGGNVGAGGRGGRQYDGCGSSGSHGIGGTTVSATTSKLFMGGGGGAGDDDDNYGTRGGNGGGIVIIFAGSIAPNGYTVSAIGETAPFSPVGGASGTDGMGGGGGGGTVAIECATYSATGMALIVDGGGGSSSQPGAGTWNYHGPGGGGGGGLVWLSTGSLPATVNYYTNAGTAGYTRNHDASRSHWEALDGSPGTISYGFVRNKSTCAVLPVSLLYFDAKKQTSSVLLSWATVSEKGSDYFSIMKSTDGITWIKIGQVKALSNSNTVNPYSYVDINPGSGIVYYQLQESDIDGAIQESEIKVVALNFISSVTISPNPNNGTFSLTIESPSKGFVEIKLMNALSQPVFESKEFVSNIFNKNYNLEGLTRGVYFLDIKTATDQQILKVIVE